MKTVCFLVFILFLSIVNVQAADELIIDIKMFPDATGQLSYKNGYERIFYKNGQEVAREERDKNEKIIKMEGKIPDGIFKINSLHEEIAYKDGQSNNVKMYNSTWVLEYEYESKNGKTTKYKVYYPNGELMYETVFNDDGTKVERNYDINGLLESVK